MRSHALAASPEPDAESVLAATLATLETWHNALSDDARAAWNQRVITAYAALACEKQCQPTTAEVVALMVTVRDEINEENDDE